MSGVDLLQDYSKEERRDLAQKSRAQLPSFGNAERQAVTSAAHQRMLEREAVSSSARVVCICCNPRHARSALQSVLQLSAALLHLEADIVLLLSAGISSGAGGTARQQLGWCPRRSSYGAESSSRCHSITSTCQ